MLSLWARVDQGVMTMKGYFAFPKVLALLEPHHLIVSCHIQDTRLGVSYPSAEMQLVYSTTSVNLARFGWRLLHLPNPVFVEKFWWKSIKFIEVVQWCIFHWKFKDFISILFDLSMYIVCILMVYSIDIYHRCAQGKAGQDPKSQSF